MSEVFKRKRVVLSDGTIRFIRTMSPEQVLERDELNRRNTAEALRKRVLAHKAWNPPDGRPRQSSS